MLHGLMRSGLAMTVILQVAVAVTATITVPRSQAGKVAADSGQEALQAPLVWLLPACRDTAWRRWRGAGNITGIHGGNGGSGIVVVRYQLPGGAILVVR
jgi:hypothetical protein